MSTLACVPAVGHDIARESELDKISSETTLYLKEYRTSDNISVFWHKSIKSLPPAPTIIIGQEFLDTFPVYQFVRDKNKNWRELLVDIDEGSESPLHFRYVVASQPTPAVLTLLDIIQLYSSMSVSSSFHKGNSKALRERSTVSADAGIDINSGEDGISSGLEISPLCLSLVEEVARFLLLNKGCALFIDYGENYSQVIRTISKQSEACSLTFFRLLGRHAPGIQEAPAMPPFVHSRRSRSHR